MASYIALIHKDSESHYGVSFPDFPGCITAGETLDETKDMAAEALAGHVATMREFGEPIPKPTSLETILTEPESSGAAVLVVPLLPARARIVRVNVTLSEDELHAIDETARRHGMTRSGFLRRAAQKAINE